MRNGYNANVFQLEKLGPFFPFVLENLKKKLWFVLPLRKSRDIFLFMIQENFVYEKKIFSFHITQ